MQALKKPNKPITRDKHILTNTLILNYITSLSWLKSATYYQLWDTHT